MTVLPVALEMMAACSSKLYRAVAAQNVLPSYLSGSARMAPMNFPVSPTASIRANLVLGERARARTQVPSGAGCGAKKVSSGNSP